MPSKLAVRQCATVGCGAEIQAPKLPKAAKGGLAARFTQAVAGATRYCDPCIDRMEAEQAAQQAAVLLRRRREAAMVPRALAPVTFNLLDRDGAARMAAIQDAERWAAGEIPGLVLAGEVGSGKTWIAAAAANAFLERASLRWATTPALVAKALSDDHDEKLQAVNILLAHRGAIVLDDFDKVSAKSEWAVSQLFQAVDNAVTWQRPLLVTTNMGAAELGRRFGEPIMSRLLGYCAAHKLEGHDRRTVKEAS